MFNFVMGIIMIGIGVVSVTRAFFTSQMAGYIFFGVLMIGFGIVEMVRSRSVRARKKAARDREFDMYTMIANQMGVAINPLTGEIVEKEKNKDLPQQPQEVSEEDPAQEKIAVDN